jgi:tRNA(Ile)-lysidine synthase
VLEALADDTWVHGLLGRCTFPRPGTEVTCALSGGADSTALTALAVASGCTVTAVHVHHGVRADADLDAAAAAASAQLLGASFRVERVELSAGPNFEARARRARLEVLGPESMTGHTLDDQAETIVLALLRGAGATGLAGMRPGRHHPILALRGAETRQLCDHLGLFVISDPTNTDPRFRRNRVRHEVLPLLDHVGERDVALLLDRTATLLRDDDDLLDEMAEQLDPTAAAPLASAPLPLARRAIRRWLDDGGNPPDSAPVARR